MSALHNLTALQRLQHFQQQVVKEVFVAMLQRGLEKQESLHMIAEALLQRISTLQTPKGENKMLFTKAIGDVKAAAECLQSLLGDSTATTKAVDVVLDSKSGLLYALKQSLSINPWKKVATNFMSTASATMEAMPGINAATQAVHEMMESQSFKANSFAVTTKLFAWKDSVRPGLPFKHSMRRQFG